MTNSLTHALSRGVSNRGTEGRSPGTAQAGRRNRRALWSLSLTCLSWCALLACGGDSELVEISSQKAALTASENSERALHGLVDAADFLTASSSIANTLGAIGGTTEECDSSVVPCTSDSSSCPEPVTVCTSTSDGADLGETRDEIRDGMQALVDRLRERVLIPENLETETPTSATYRLGADVLCDSDDTPDVSPGSSAPSEADADCIDQAERYQLRLRLTSPREGDVDMTLLVGEAQNAPLTVHLFQHSLGVQLDLGEVLDAARDLGEDVGSLKELAGVLQLELVENAPLDYSLELDVLSALHVVAGEAGETVSASLGASSPALHLRVDGNAQRLTAGIDLGALELLGPLSSFAGLFGADAASNSAGPNSAGSGDSEDSFTGAPPAEERSYTGNIKLLLAGLSSTVSYVADSDVLNFTDVGFGDRTSTLEHDGKRLFALDLNPTRGRRLNLVVEPDGDGTKVSITPTLDLALSFAFHNIADQFDDIADYLLDNTLHVWLEGSAPVVEIRDEQVQVVSGSLNLTSSFDPAHDLSVLAGECLLDASDASDETDEPGAGAPFATLSAGTCE